MAASPTGFAGIEAIVEGNSAGIGLSVEETRAIYDGFGWRRIYSSAMGQPGDPDGPPARGVNTSIQELDAAQADAYFAFFGAARPDPAEHVGMVDAPFSLGDGAVVVNITVDNAEAGERYSELRVIFHRGDVFGHVAMWTNIPAQQGTPEAIPSGSESPAGTVDELEQLGRRQLERINAVLAGDSPNLPGIVLRIGEDAFFDSSGAYSEGYRLLDGELPPYYGFEDDVLADPNGTTGADAVYELEQGFVRGEDAAPGDAYYLNRLYRFPDNATAEAFMASRPEALATGGFRLATGATDETRSDLVPGEASNVGDESMAFAFVRAFDDGRRAEGYEVYVRVGNTVAAVSLEGPPDTPLGQVTDLAEAQAACLEAGECPAGYPVPEEFSAPISGTSEATPTT